MEEHKGLPSTDIPVSNPAVEHIRDGLGDHSADEMSGMELKSIAFPPDHIALQFDLVQAGYQFRLGQLVRRFELHHVRWHFVLV